MFKKTKEMIGMREELALLRGKLSVMQEALKRSEEKEQKKEIFVAGDKVLFHVGWRGMGLRDNEVREGKVLMVVGKYIKMRETPYGSAVEEYWVSEGNITILAVIEKPEKKEGTMNCPVCGADMKDFTGTPYKYCQMSDGKMTYAECIHGRSCGIYDSKFDEAIGRDLPKDNKC